MGSEEEHTHTEDKDSVIEHLTQQLDFYKSELATTQAHEQRVSRELITYMLMERDALRRALEGQ